MKSRWLHAKRNKTHKFFCIPNTWATPSCTESTHCVADSTSIPSSVGVQMATWIRWKTQLLTLMPEITWCQETDLWSGSLLNCKAYSIHPTKNANLCLHVEVHLTADGQGALHAFRSILHRLCSVSNHQVVNRWEKWLGRDRVLHRDNGRLYVTVRNFHGLCSLFSGCLRIWKKEHQQLLSSSFLPWIFTSWIFFPWIFSHQILKQDRSEHDPSNTKQNVMLFFGTIKSQKTKYKKYNKT